MIIIYSKIKRYLLQNLPPFFIKIIKFFCIKISLYFTKFKDVDLFSNEKCRDYKSIYYEIDSKNRRGVFFVDIEKLYYFGGIKYTSNKHPFTAYYHQGIGALKSFYGRHIPNCIMEKHFINAKEVYPLKGVDLPWYSVREKNYDTGEHGLNYTHGDQHFGPVSDQKIELEAKRLDKLKDSMLLHGYRKFYDGYPRGYVLENNDSYSVLIVGGQHRVAALIYLGYEILPIIFSKSYPPIVNINDVDNWPYVKAGIVKKSDAIRIFNSYFDE